MDIAITIIAQYFSFIITKFRSCMHSNFISEVLSLVAHDDAIWSVAWGTNKKENSETVVTGSLDDLVKVWKW